MQSYFQWLQDLSISNWIATDETIWSFPLILFLHSVGMGLTAGVMFIICLRLVGVGRPLPVSSMRMLFRIRLFQAREGRVLGMTRGLPDRWLRRQFCIGRWRVNRVNDSWVLVDEDGRVDFEDSSLGSVAFLLGMYADLNEKPDTVIDRYYSDLFERQE